MRERSEVVHLRHSILQPSPGVVPPLSHSSPGSITWERSCIRDGRSKADDKRTVVSAGIRRTEIGASHKEGLRKSRVAPAVASFCNPNEASSEGSLPSTRRTVSTANVRASSPRVGTASSITWPSPSRATDSSGSPPPGPTW